MMMLLAVSLLPLIKGLKDSASTDNYRYIAGTLLLIRMFERVILILWGPGIQNDDLQLGFKERTGIVQCMWLVQETLNYFLTIPSEL